MNNVRLTLFIGNNPLCESEHGGELFYKESFSGVNYLVPVSEHLKYLHEYAMQVQQAVNKKPET